VVNASGNTKWDISRSCRYAIVIISKVISYLMSAWSFCITILSYNGTFPFKRTIIIVVIIRITAQKLLLLLLCMLKTINYFVEWDILILDFW